MIQEGEGEDDSDFVDDYEETEEETLEEEENIYVISDKPNPTLSKSKNLSIPSSTTKRYSDLLHLSKEIAKIGPKTQNSFEMFKKNLIICSPSIEINQLMENLGKPLEERGGVHHTRDNTKIP